RSGGGSALVRVVGRVDGVTTHRDRRARGLLSSGLVLQECFRAAPGALRAAVSWRPRARARGNLNGRRPRALGRQLRVLRLLDATRVTCKEDRGISLLVAAIRSSMRAPQGWL